MENRGNRTIVFVTGAFVSHHCWDEWQRYFEARGYACLVPPWLYKDATVAELRGRHPDPHLAALRLPQLVDHFAGIIKALPEKPILIGHSYGGLLTQLLLQRDLAAAGVAIDSVAPQGVFTFKWSFYRATWGPLGLFTDVNKPFMMSFRQWQYAFVNGMELEEQRAAYEQLTIPESKRISRDALTRAAHVDFQRPHVPLLLVAGERDHIMPASLNASNYRRYARYAGSVTAFKEFAGRNHFILGQPGWQEVADYVLGWLEQQELAPESTEAAVPELAGVQ
ncbi:alpha/beta hydrolase [Hymenobacter sp. 15J16-1T3B]|uniref:alpha/beta hydrolase n=1 Tax=Hymenobacter sp. 15J16-1T3B TaxID=2886941 RepID=UPI001D10B2CF|nr:alpha/beta hydrolase [Hymenobacter sp. 15J16-1T3B]MCC3157549.1 alpha/beta hydrolase [Hymenobacter sp. 15J16-1T3B]